MGTKKPKKSPTESKVKQISQYSDTVLIGNWCEERKKYVKSIVPWSTWYSTDYPQKKKAYDNDDFWKNRYKGNGIPIHHMFGQGDTDEYFKNQATVHDLSFHHLFKDPLGKVHGIQTKTGLQIDKEADWAEFKNANAYTTSHQVQYQSYPEECFKVKHWKPHHCDEYIQEPNQPDKCVLYKRVPLRILPGL